MGQQLGLMPRQRDCLTIIRAYIAQNRCSPSYDYLMKELGLESKSGVNRLVTALEERGHITRRSGRARSIALVDGDAVSDGVWPIPANIEAKLFEHCRRTGDKPGDVVADAVALFLDQAEADAA